jgi:hypothetical protein
VRSEQTIGLGVSAKGEVLFEGVARSVKVLGAAVLLALVWTGCAAEGPNEPVATAHPASSLQGDLVELAAPVGVAAEIPIAAASSQTSSLEPKVIYLIYADGKTSTTSGDACSGVVPAFNCTFGTSLLDCEQQIQTLLDQWFADFNVVFTLSRPTSGSYYTAVVSSGGGAWCGVKDTVAGVAPRVCAPVGTGVAFTLDGGSSAHDTAVVIAHEQGHLLGLGHVTDDNEIMFPFICASCDRFENSAFSVSDDACRRPTQNSYQMMMAALGPWGGGPKPSAFRCVNGTSSPVVSFVSPSDGERMGHNFLVTVDASDDCALASVAISVEPQGLSATATRGPFQWDLTGIDGNQTITVTATNGAGHTTAAKLAIFAPSAGQVAESSANASGCTISSGAFSAAGLIPALAMPMLLVLCSRRRSGRRRPVPGSSAEEIGTSQSSL